MRRKWSAVSWSALRTGKKELWALADSCLTFKKPLSAMIYYSIRPSSSHSLGSRNSSYPALCSHHVTHCHTFAHCLCPSVHEALLPGTGLGPAMAAAQRPPAPTALGPTVRVAQSLTRCMDRGRREWALAGGVRPVPAGGAWQGSRQVGIAERRGAVKRKWGFSVTLGLQGRGCAWVYSVFFFLF